MFQNKAIRYIFLVPLCIGILFPLINIYFIYPSFTNLLIENTENEALRLGRHLSEMYFRDKRPLSKNDINNIEERVREHTENFHLMKLKIFSPSGEIIYSTDKNDIGKVNQKDYFHNIVAKGQPFTKVVQKDTQSLEEQTVTMDVVETYVPIMSDGKFIGAFEIYYDITARNQKLNSVIFKSSVIPLVMMIGGLTLTIIILIQLDKSMIRQKKAKEELKLFAERLQRSNRELQDFAHIASHDLQEPLRKVLAFGDRLKTKYADVLDEQGRDYLERMQKASKRMQNLIQGLLMFSRVTTKAQPFTTVDLSKVAKEVLSDLEVRIQETGGRVEVGELPTISADPLQMQQLFQNLISNALKFNKKNEPPLVKISSMPVNSNGDWSGSKFYKIIFEDNGIGFDEKYADRIFGVFQRLHGRNEYEGTGIGLSVCRKIVERHGGTITAESTPGKGAKFIVTLPVEHPEDANVDNGIKSSSIIQL